MDRHNIPPLPVGWTREVINAGLPPPVMWAQRAPLVFLTINLADVEDPQIKFTKYSVYFHGVVGVERKKYEVTMKLYKEIDPEKSKFFNRGRCIEVVLAKANPGEPYWPYLMSDKKKHHWLKCDFNMWHDEDDSGDEALVERDFEEIMIQEGGLEQLQNTQINAIDRHNIPLNPAGLTEEVINEEASVNAVGVPVNNDRYLQSNLDDPPEYSTLFGPEASQNTERDGQGRYGNVTDCVCPPYPPEIGPPYPPEIGPPYPEIGPPYPPEISNALLRDHSRYPPVPPVTLLTNLEEADQLCDQNDIHAVITVGKARMEVRLAYLRKVYGLLIVQLSIIFCIAAVFRFTPPIRIFFETNELVIWIVTCFICVMIWIPLATLKTKTSGKLILLTPMVICLTIALGVATTHLSDVVVVAGFLSPLLIFGCLWLYTSQYEYDYNSLYMGGFIIVAIITIAGFVNLLLHADTLELTLTYLVVSVLCLYVIMDVSVNMEVLSPDEHIAANVNFYLDVIRFCPNLPAGFWRR